MRGRWAPLLLVAALAAGVVGTTFLYVNGRPAVYAGRAVVSLSPRGGDGPVGADNLELAASRYQAYLSSPANLERVAAQLGEDPTALRSATRVTVQPNTVTIAVVVTLRDPTRAAQAANAVAATGLRQARSDRLVSMELVAPAVVPQQPSGPNRRLAMLVGLGAALGLAVLALGVLGYFRSAARALGAGPDPLRVLAR